MSEIHVNADQTTISTATVRLEFDAEVFNSADYFEVEITIFPTEREFSIPQYERPEYLRPVTKKVRLKSSDLYRLGLSG